MAKKRYLSAFIRHPRTQQEIKANLDKNDPLVRGRRKNLPTAWDDQYVHHQKSWKYLRRKKQYRDTENDYSWHIFKYNSWHDRQTLIDIVNQLQALGCYYQFLFCGVKWFGPELCNRGLQ